MLRADIFDRIDGVILDLDGTVLDSMWVWHEVDRRYLGKRGIDVPDDYMRAINHMSVRETAEYSIARFHLTDTPEELEREWEELARDAYMYEVQLKPYVREFVELAYNMGLRLGVATSTIEGLAEPVLERNGILQYISQVTYTREVTRGKGYPDVYLRAAGKLGIRPDRAMVLEDILHGVIGAKSGGFVVVGVQDDSSIADWEQIKWRADGYIDSFRELICALNEENDTDSEKEALQREVRDYILSHKGAHLSFPLVARGSEHEIMREVMDSTAWGNIYDSDQYIAEWNNRVPFGELVMRYCEQYGYRLGTVCRNAGIDRQTYTKFKQKRYLPTRDVLVALVLSLGLTVEEAKALYISSDYRLNINNLNDLVIMYCLENGVRDVSLAKELMRDMYNYRER